MQNSVEGAFFPETSERDGVSERLRSEYLELRKTLNVLSSECERCTAPVRRFLAEKYPCSGKSVPRKEFCMSSI